MHIKIKKKIDKNKTAVLQRPKYSYCPPSV